MTSEREEHQSGAAMQPGTRWILLTDDVFVEDRFGLTRLTGTPVKDPGNPILRDAGSAPVVLRDDEQGCFHMWLQGCDRDAWEHQFKLNDFEAAKHFYPYFIRYARSEDGVHWDMPDLGLVKDPKGRWGNIILTGDWRAQAHWVWLNPDRSDPKRRFLMTYKDRPGGGGATLFLASSPDGVRFKRERAVLRHGSDGVHESVYDDERNRWLLYTRPSNRALVREGPYEDFNIKRRVIVHVGPTPWEWSYGRSCIFPEEECDVPDIDAVYVFKHGTHFIALLQMMDMSRQGLNEVHIATSRDGLTWQRYPHRPVFLARGEEDAWDAGQVHCPRIAGLFNDQLVLYYYGSPQGQKVRPANPGGLGIARLTPGRWLGVSAGDRGGYLLTRELKIEGGRLQVNFQPDGADSFVRARLLQRDPAAPPDTPARPVPGFGFDDCTPVTDDTPCADLHWTGGADLSAFVGQSGYLHLHIRNGTVFGVRLA